MSHTPVNSLGLYYTTETWTFDNIRQLSHQDLIIFVDIQTSGWVWCLPICDLNLSACQKGGQVKKKDDGRPLF